MTGDSDDDKLDNLLNELSGKKKPAPTRGDDEEINRLLDELTEDEKKSEHRHGAGIVSGVPRRFQPRSTA